MWYQKLVRVFRRHHIFLRQDFLGKVEGLGDWATGMSILHYFC